MKAFVMQLDSVYHVVAAWQRLKHTWPRYPRRPLSVCGTGESARVLYEAIICGTGDIPGGEAYAKYAEVCSSKRKKAEEAKQAKEILEAR